MNRNQAIEALRNDIIDACGELTFERLLVARNLIRALVEQQETGYPRTITHSDIMPKAQQLSPSVAKAQVQRQTDPPEALAGRRRG